MAARKVTVDDIAHLAGTMPLREIGKQAGITGERVRQLFNQAGLETTWRDWRKPKTAEEIAEEECEVVSMRLSGMKLEEIWRELGIGWNRLQQILKAHQMTGRLPHVLPDERECKKCKRVKPIDEFHGYGRGLTSRMHACKQCHVDACVGLAHIRAEKWNRGEVLERWCPRHDNGKGKMIPASEWGSATAAYCRPCHRDYYRNKRQAQAKAVGE